MNPAGTRTCGSPCRRAFFARARLGAVALQAAFVGAWGRAWLAVFASEVLVFQQIQTTSRLNVSRLATNRVVALDEATKRFIAGRETFRQLFVDLMDLEKLDAMLYPANHARPHTHEGGLERYGSEPGTCEESAATGLPQVTVPAGFIGGRYPAGISFLGRMWDDKRLLEIAAAYERATHHRRPPPTVRP